MSDVDSEVDLDDTEGALSKADTGPADGPSVDGGCAASFRMPMPSRSGVVSIDVRSFGAGAKTGGAVAVESAGLGAPEDAVGSQGEEGDGPGE